MIQKTTGACVERSVVDMNGTAYVFVAARPDCDGQAQQQTLSALRRIQRVVQMETSRGAVTQQTVFVREAYDLETCKRTVKEFYGDRLPATT